MSKTTLALQHLDRTGIERPTIHTLEGQWPCTVVWTSNAKLKRREILPTPLFNVFIPTRDVVLQETTGVLGRRDFTYTLGKIGFSPSQQARVLEWIGRLEGYTFFFHPDIIAKASQTCFGENFEDLKWRGGKGDFAPAIAYLGIDIAAQVTTGLPAGTAHVESQIETFLSMVLRRYSSTPHRNTALVGIYSPLILKVVNFVDHHLSEPLTMNMISHECGASISHLGRLFRDEMGDSVWSFVQRRRLSMAAELLQKTDLMISQIGQRCGYPDAKHFSRQFKSQFKLSPENYRLKHFAKDATT